MTKERKCDIININLYILLYLLDRNNYNTYRKYISNKKEDKNLNYLYKLLDELFEKHPERDAFLLEEYIAYVKSKVGQDETIDLLLSQLTSAEIGKDVLHDLVEESRNRAFAMELALKAIDVSEGKNSFDSLLTHIDSYGKIDSIEDEIEFVSTDLEELLEHRKNNAGIKWRLKTLNSMLGPLSRGHFGFLFARPETGKTTFLASEVSYFAEQVKNPILWFNNEQEGEEVALRILQASLGLTMAQLRENVVENKRRFSELTGNRIKLIDRANIYRQDVEKICEKYKPSLIVFDQIDKIKGFDADREDLRLGSIYVWARELAKEYSPAIGVCQADGSGEGKKWLTMENVSNAKTSKQAEADWILGIGRSNEPGYEYVRYLHLSKNKLPGDEETVPALRHGRMDVIISPEIARYVDVQ